MKTTLSIVTVELTKASPHVDSGEVFDDIPAQFMVARSSVSLVIVISISLITQKPFLDLETVY